MKIFMDADCLIKLTKASLKELIVQNFEVFVPELVENEVVTQGKKFDCPDADIVESNIQKKAIKVVKHEAKYKKGDEALTHIFSTKTFQAIATDDAKLIRKLKVMQIPFLLPATLIYKLFTRRLLTKTESLNSLHQLKNFISDDEFTTTCLLLKEESK